MEEGFTRTTVNEKTRLTVKVCDKLLVFLCLASVKPGSRTVPHLKLRRRLLPAGGLL